MPATLSPNTHLDGVPVLVEAVDALSRQQQEAVLVVVHLLDVQVLARRKVHDVDVEVVRGGLGHQLAQTEHLARHWEQGRVLGVPMHEVRRAL